jgi:hypothetical protein
MAFHRALMATVAAFTFAALLSGCERPYMEKAEDRSAGGGSVASNASVPPQSPSAASGGMGGPAAVSSPEQQKKAAGYVPPEGAGGGETANKATFAAMADSQPDRYLIKNATLTVEADDVRKATTALVQAVQAAKGYVSDMHEQSDGIGGLTATMQVRVPYTIFDSSMQQLSALGKVLEKQVTAQDVTEEFVDTQAKVRNLKRTELRLLDHLGRTGRLSDTLLVEKELNRVREEVEQLEGRVRFLSHRIAFSTISVTLKEKARIQALVPAESYSAAKEGSDALRSLVEFGRSVLTLLIWVGIWVPVWLPIAAVCYWMVRALLRKQRDEQAARPSYGGYGAYGVTPPAPVGAPPGAGPIVS